MKNILLFIFICISLGSSSCKNEVAKQTEKPNKVSETKSKVPYSKEFPSITMAMMEKMWNEVDYIDYIFYETDFSMSMNQKESIQSVLRHVSEQPPFINPNCKPMGRVFFEIDGNTYLEADIHFSKECKYFAFYEDKKLKYANLMSEEGIKHFSNILKMQFSQQKQKQ